MILLLSKDDLCAQHHIVSAYDSLDKTRAVFLKLEKRKEPQ